MKYKILMFVSAFCILHSAFLFAQAPIPLTIDSRAPTAPGIDPYQASRTVYRVSFTDGANPVSLTSATPWMSWSSNAYASSYSTASYVIVNSSGGVVDFTFTAAALNPPYGPGRYLYEVGLNGANGITVYRQGILTLRGSPYAEGVPTATWTTNAVNWGGINWVGLPTTMAGWGIVDGVDRAEFIAVSGQVATAQSDIDAHGALTGVSVHGLGTAALHASNDFATAAQGTLAGTALQSEADTNALATLTLHTNTPAMTAHSGLGTAATNPASAFATSTQGDTADTAGSNATIALAGVLSQSNRIDTLNTATNALNTSVAGLKTATNAINTRVGVAETDVTGLQSATNSMTVRILATEAGTNTLNTRMTAAESATNYLSGQVATLKTATNNLQAQATAALAGVLAQSNRIDDLAGGTNNYITADTIVSNAFRAADTAVSNGVIIKFQAADAGISNSYTAADAVVSNGLDDKITAEATARGNADIGISNAYALADTGVSNGVIVKFTAADVGISNAYKAADLTVSNGVKVLFQAADAGISNAYIAADTVVSNGLNNKITAESTTRGNSDTGISNAYTLMDTVISNSFRAADTVISNALSERITANAGYTNYAYTAYAWGDHALAGYITSATNIFNGLYSANRSVLGANLSGLTQGTYTGALTSVSYTGVTELAQGKTYAWGFTKANAFGTSTLSIATYSLIKTSSGATSNYFTYKGTDSNLVLKLDGDGSSKSDVSGLYVKQITNGDINAAGDINAGGTIYLDGAAIVNPTAHIAATGTNVHGLGDMSLKSSTVYYDVSATDILLAGYVPTNNAVYTDTVAKASAALQSESDTNALTQLALETSARTNSEYLQGLTNAHFEAIKLNTNSADYQNLLTNTATKAQGDLADNAVPKSATNGWTVTSHTGFLTNETYLGTIVGATIVTGAAPAVTTNGGMLNFTVPSGGGGSSGFINPTQEISWIYYDSPLAVTNLLVSGAVEPHANGIYVEIAEQQGQRAWQSTNGYYNVYDNSQRAISPDIYGSEAYWVKAGTVATGFYPHIDGAPGMPSSTGDVTVVYQYSTTTNSHIWKAGAVDKTKWSISLDGTNLGIIYPGSNVFPNPIYGNGAGLTNVNATNATALGGVASATWQEATNAINTVANAAVKRAGDIMTGPLTNTYKFYGDGGGLTNLTAPDATNALALGNIAAATWSEATNAINTTANAALPKSSTNSLAVTALQVTGLSGNGVVPVGASMIWWATNAPPGWLVMQGQAVSTNIYSNLYTSAAGQCFVISGTNMIIPDMQGRVPVGMGTGAGLTARNLNETGGAETHSHAAGTFAAGAHTHTGPSHAHSTSDHTLTTTEMPSHNHVVAIPTGVTAGGGSGKTETTTVTYSDSFDTGSTGGGAAHNHGNTGNAGTGDTGSATPSFSGTSGATTNMMPFRVVNYIIKY